MVGDLIYICGPDGAGKSTQAILLIENLKQRGMIFEYRWLRFHHFFSLPLLFIARLMGLSSVKTLKTGEKIGCHYFYKSNTISKLYPILLFLDTLLFTTIKLYIPKILFKKNILCDRFIYDTIVDVMISTGKDQFQHVKIMKLFLSLIPKDSKTILLVTNEEILKNRRNDIKFDRTIGLKIELYRKIASEFNIPLIDVNLSIEEVQKLIMDNLGWI